MKRLIQSEKQSRNSKLALTNLQLHAVTGGDELLEMEMEIPSKKQKNPG